MADAALLLAGWGTHPERLQPIADRLVAAGIEAEVWPYAASGSVTRIARGLVGATAGRLGHGARIHLIGHSLGGLVVADAALRHLDDELVASVTTINSPWRGTWVAYTGNDGLARDIAWGASALSDLRADLTGHLERERGPRWLVLGAAFDLATPPSTSIRVPRAPRLERALVPVAGHSQSLDAPRLIDRVVAHVAATAEFGDGRDRDEAREDA